MSDARRSPSPGCRPGSTQTRTRRARGSLSEGEILDGAQYLVEQYGLQQLSMPALAKHLGSGVTSIYWYFRTKDELLRAVTDRVTRQMYRALPPIGDGPWESELLEYFVAFRQVLEATPIYREVFAYRARMLFAQAAMGPSMFRRLEAGLELCTRAGLTPQQAAEVFNACANYTRGFVVLAHGRDPDPAEAATGRALPRLDPARFPNLGQLPDLSTVMSFGDEQFMVGLRLLISGVRQRYAS
jgi:AcrR family transcriptional regulator